MSNENLLEVYRQLRLAQDKYTYFLLAAVGAAIGLAITQTQGSALSWSQIPLALGVLCWGLSFIFGCLHLLNTSSALYTNAEKLRVESGINPMVGNDPQKMVKASQILSESFEKSSNRANRNSKWQFRFLVLGAIFYIGWHVLEMLIKTLSQ
jgi:hypothetical protein